LGGPIKGSYAIIDEAGRGERYDYISDFGMRVEDPCKAIENTLNINLTPHNTTTKDLKYHQGTDSKFWLTQCTGLKALRFVEYFPSIELHQGKLFVFSTPPD